MQSLYSVAFLEECNLFTSIYEVWLHCFLVWKIFTLKPKEHPLANYPISPPHLLSYCLLLGSQGEETQPVWKGLKCEECLQVSASACSSVCWGRWENLGLKKNLPYKSHMHKIDQFARDCSWTKKKKKSKSPRLPVIAKPSTTFKIWFTFWVTSQK